MIRTTMISVAVTVVFTGAIGCDPRAFSDLEGDTWVDTSGQPGGMESDDYVFALTFAAGGSTAGSRLVVMGNGPSSIGTIDYSANGDTESSGKRITDLVTIDESTTFDDRRPLAGSTTVLGTGGIVAVGLPAENNGQGSVLLVDMATLEPFRQMGAVPGLSDQGAAVAFGATDYEDAGGPDLVTSATNNAVLYPDVLTSPGPPALSCPVGREVVYAVLAADLKSGDTGDEVLLMRGDAVLDGTASASDIVVTTGGNIAAASEDTDTSLCFDATAAVPRAPLATIDAPGGENDFGMKMLAADFDGNGDADIVAAAPSGNVVYVYMNLDVAAVGTPLTISAPSGATGFGLSIAAGDLDGSTGDELAVGAPTTTVDGTTGAGSVFVYKFGGTDFGAPVNQLHDIEPESSQEFGRDVAIAPFATSGGILGVAASGELFTYFRTAQSFPDVRQ